MQILFVDVATNLLRIKFKFSYYILHNIVLSQFW